MDYISLDYALQLQIGIRNAIAAGEAALPLALSVLVGRAQARALRGQFRFVLKVLRGMAIDQSGWPLGL